jgi:DegV family protein with EDD domain
VDERGPQIEKAAVITDSAASIPNDVPEGRFVRVVPMNLVLGGTVYADGTIDPDEVLRRASAERVSTSAPSPGEYLKAVEAARDDGFTGAVVVTVSSKMSGSFEAAHAAAGYLPEGTVRVLDSGTAAGAQGLVVLRAARCAMLGTPRAEIFRCASAVARDVKLTATLPDLDYLSRSGRVPGLAARASRSTGIRPIFSFGTGNVRPRRPALSGPGALDHIVADCARTRPEQPARLHAAILDSGSGPEAASLAEAVGELSPARRIFHAPFSSVMVAHTGPGLVGLGWWWEIL